MKQGARFKTIKVFPEDQEQQAILWAKQELIKNHGARYRILQSTQPQVGQKWRTPGGQVYEILEDTGGSFRCDVHDEKGGLTPNSWTFSHDEFVRMIKSMPLETVSTTTMPPDNYPGFRGPADDPRRSIAVAAASKVRDAFVCASDPLAGINENQAKMESIYKSLCRLANKYHEAMTDDVLGKLRQRMVEIQALVESSLPVLTAFQKIGKGSYIAKTFDAKVEELKKTHERIDHILRDPKGYTAEHSQGAEYPHSLVVRYRELADDAWHNTRAALTIGRSVQRDLERA
jgi:hypothetical protein